MVQGEYVTFELCRVDDSKHKWQAGVIRGINDGKLMCETRLESRQTRTINKDTDDNTRHKHPQSRHSADGDDSALKQHKVRTRGLGPRDGDEWMLVRTKRGAAQSGGQNVSQNAGRMSSRAGIPVDILKSRNSKNVKVDKHEDSENAKGNQYENLGEEH